MAGCASLSRPTGYGLGVKVAISTDAHSIADLNFMRLGIGQARRGWLEAADVLNTRPWPQLQKLLQRI
jgi:DNA polymerase (family 10)